MNLGLIVLLTMMMDGGPTVMGAAASGAGILGFTLFITGSSAVAVAYLMKKRKRKNQS
ncbi:MAG: hypothetical protein ACXACF_07030 [Candidatus Hermodarchaeia archaeon]